MADGRVGLLFWRRRAHPTAMQVATLFAEYKGKQILVATETVIRSVYRYGRKKSLLL